MTMAGTTLRKNLVTDFSAACADLAEAKRAVRAKDTPAARARVLACAATVDAILDLGNDSAEGRA